MKPGLLKTEHCVVSADGTRYIVRYVHKPGTPEEEAELRPLNDDGSWESGERYQLPTSELKRIPVTKLPPITGMPEVRPRCPMCDKLLLPWTESTHGKHYSQVVSRTFKRWRGYWADSRTSQSALFCSMNCALYFARASYGAGYRIQRKKP